MAKQKSAVDFTRQMLRIEKLAGIKYSNIGRNVTDVSNKNLERLSRAKAALDKYSENIRKWGNKKGLDKLLPKDQWHYKVSRNVYMGLSKG